MKEIKIKVDAVGADIQILSGEDLTKEEVKNIIYALEDSYLQDEKSSPKRTIFQFGINVDTSKKTKKSAR